MEKIITSFVITDERANALRQQPFFKKFVCVPVGHGETEVQVTVDTPGDIHLFFLAAFTAGTYVMTGKPVHIS